MFSLSTDPLWWRQDDARVRLPDGRLMPAVAASWLVVAHDRGLAVTVRDGALRVSPAARLTEDDRRLVRAYAAPLRAMLEPWGGVTAPHVDDPATAIVGSVEEVLAVLDRQRVAVTHPRVAR